MEIFIDDSGTPSFFDPANKSLGLTAILTKERTDVESKVRAVCAQYGRDPATLKWRKTTTPERFRTDFIDKVILGTDVKIINYYQDRDHIPSTVWTQLSKNRRNYYLRLSEGLAGTISSKLGIKSLSIVHDTFGQEDLPDLIKSAYEEVFLKSSIEIKSFNFDCPASSPAISISDFVGGMLREITESAASMIVVKDGQVVE